MVKLLLGQVPSGLLGFLFKKRNLRLESKDEKARKVLELADDICYSDSKGNEIRQRFLEPFKSAVLLFGEFFECVVLLLFWLVSWVCTMLKYMLVVYLVNMFFFYTMLTLYQAVRQGRNTVDSTGNLRYKNVGGRSVCITIRTLLHGKINPKDWQVLSLSDVGFLLFFRVVSGDYGKPCLYIISTSIAL